MIVLFSFLPFIFSLLVGPLLSSSIVHGLSSLTPKEHSTISPPTTASSKFKAPNDQTPPDLVQKWKSDDTKLLQYIHTTIPSVLHHTGSSAFDEHLSGVQSVLRYWNAPSHLVSAGLFHSIYGTEGFQGFTLPLSERMEICKLIGKKSERLCWIFCMVDRWSVDRTVFDWTPTQQTQTPLNHNKNNNNDDPTVCDEEEEEAMFVSFWSRPELGRFEIQLTKTEWLDFLELSLADWLEQVEGAASKPSSLFLWKKVGEAYAYRRLAYRKMSQILVHERSSEPDSLRLVDVVPQMLNDVMATEQQYENNGKIKNGNGDLLVQMRTPPMSDAAAMALDALRSAGEEDIPINLAPVLMTKEQQAPYL